MIYKTKSKFRAAVEPEFPVTVGQMLASYPQNIALIELRRQVEAKFTIKSGAMYNGELEAMVLTPLYRAIKDSLENPGSSGLLVKHAFQLAAEYAIIAEIAQVSQVKEVARELTASAITMSPVYNAFKLAFGSFKSKTSEGKQKGKDEDQDAIDTAWKAINRFLKSSLAEGTTVNPDQATPLYVLMTMQQPDSIAETAQSTWELLVSHLKQGKGRPLSQAGASQQAMLLNSVWLAICELCDAALDQMNETTSASNDERATFADAWTALQWFDAYLDMYGQYDALFPSAIMQQQSTAWVLALRNQALKYKSFYQRLSKVAQSFDIATFIEMWEEQMQFLRPALPMHLNAVKELDDLWARLKQIAQDTMDIYSMTASRATINDLKAYLDVDILLPAYLFKSISGALDDWTIPDPSPTASGAEYLTQGDTRGIQEIYSGTKTQLLLSLTAAAGYLETALGFAARSLSVLSSGSALESAPLIPSPTWSSDTKLEGHLGEYRYADFQLPHPVCELTPKYTGSESDIQPIIRQDLMIPKYVIPLHQQRANNVDGVYPDQAKICWSGNHEIPLDVISAAYVRQPIPACYTWHRSASVVSATIDNYERLIRGLGGLQDCKDTFWTTLASIILMYRSTYGYSVLDMLSAVMFVYVKGSLPSSAITGADETHTSDTPSWTWLEPRVPVIYGAPIHLFHNAQRGSSPNIDNIPSEKKKVVTVDLGNTSAQVAFVLHVKYPTPGPCAVVQYPMTPTSYVPITVLNTALNDDARQALALRKTGVNASNTFALGTMTDLLTSIRDYTPRKAIEFIASDAFYPGAMAMPHLLWAWSTTSALLEVETYKKSEIIRMKAKVTPLTGVMTTLTVVDNPIQIVTYDEFVNVMDSADPSPIVGEDVTKPDDSADNAPGGDNPAASADITPAAVAPAPVEMKGNSPTFGGDPQVAALEAGAVSAAPLLLDESTTDNMPREFKPMSPGSPAPQPVLKSQPTPPLAGGPSSNRDVDNPSVPAAPEVTNFWKLVQDGEIVDVIKAAQAPAGYVPATEKEYEQFSKKAAQGGDKPTDDEGESK